MIAHMKHQENHSGAFFFRVSTKVTLPWIVLRDLNTILKVSEKRGGTPFNPNLFVRFRDTFDQCGLMDVGSYTPQFTRRGPIFQSNERMLKRLDRAVCNAKWGISF